MRIIDAVWEKRNLGVTCYEVLFESNDELKEIKSMWHQFEERQYLVFKIPPNRIDIVNYLQEKNCRFIEISMSFQADLKNWTLPEKLKPVCEQCTWAKMNDDDLEFMFEEIGKNIFKTDRVYLDPYFTHKQAAQRYINWSHDALKKGEIGWKVMYQNEIVGFSLGALGGVYSQFEGTGMGLMIQYAQIQRDIADGLKICRGDYSSNNIEMLNILYALNKKLKDMKYVFIKHNN